MLAIIVPTILLVALVATPLAWRIRADRRRDRADIVRADLRSAINRRLHGESLVTVEVVPKTFWHPGRVVLSTPVGYDELAETVWRDVIERVPAGYDLLIRTGRARGSETLQRAA